MVVLPQTRSRAFYVFEKPFRLDDMKLFKNIRFYGWAVLPQTRTKFFHGVEKLFRLDVMQPLKHIQVHGWAAFPNIPRHGQAHFTALRTHFALMLCRFSTTFKWTDARAPPNRFPLISRCWRLFSSRWYEILQKHSNLWLSRAPPNTAQFLSRCWKTFSFDVMQPIKHIQVYGWAALPNILCRGPARFTALKNHFVLMLCRLSTTFKWTDGRAPPNTAQLFSRCWKLFSSGWYEAFQKHSNWWLGRAPPNTGQFFSRCWGTIWSGWFAAD